MNYDLLWQMAAVVFLYMNIMFVLALLLKRNDIVDVAWGMGFVVLAVFMLGREQGYHWRRLLLSALVFVWGLRLSIYLYLRNKGKKEDFRYAKWRKDWGKHWVIRSYLQVFITQGFFMVLVAYPLIIIIGDPSPTAKPGDFLGWALWLLGFFFEAVGDAQLMRFKSDAANRGKIMNRGLWRYTRHPNYFGETCMWWGLFFICLQVRSGWLALLSPVVMNFLLLKVSGVPMLERKYQDNPEYQHYIRSTSSFIPRIPRTQS